MTESTNGFYEGRFTRIRPSFSDTQSKNHVCTYCWVVKEEKKFGRMTLLTSNGNNELQVGDIKKGFVVLHQSLQAASNARAEAGKGDEKGLD